MTRLLPWVVLLGLASCAGGAATSPGPSAPQNPDGAGLPDTPPPPPPGPTAGPPSAEVTAGLKAFDAGNFAEARKQFEAATKKSPKDFQGFADLGQACERLGDLPAAEAAYKAALAIQPDLEAVAAQLAALEAQEGRFDDALAVARAGLEKHPQSGVLTASLAVALASKGDRDAARDAFDKAVKLTPGDPMLKYTYASFLNQWHQPGAAPLLDAALSGVKDDYAMIVSIAHEYRMAGEFAACVRALDRAVSVKDGGEPRTERGLCKLGAKDEAGAMADLQAAVGVEAGYAPGHYYLAGRLASMKRYKEAAAEYAKVVDLAPKGSLAKAAADRQKAALDAAAHDKGAVAPPKKKP